MSYHTVRFEPVTRRARKNLPCPRCSKKVRRQQTFSMTISPFNKNPDGTVRTRAQIVDALRERAAAWQTEPVECTPCLEEQATAAGLSVWAFQNQRRQEARP